MNCKGCPYFPEEMGERVTRDVLSGGPSPATMTSWTSSTVRGTSGAKVLRGGSPDAGTVDSARWEVKNKAHSNYVLLLCKTCFKNQSNPFIPLKSPPHLDRNQLIHSAQVSVLLSVLVCLVFWLALVGWGQRWPCCFGVAPLQPAGQVRLQGFGRAVALGQEGFLLVAPSPEGLQVCRTPFLKRQNDKLHH